MEIDIVPLSEVSFSAESVNPSAVFFYFLMFVRINCRLTPVYMLLLAFNATWLVKMQDGPLWAHISDTERTFCRNNWWANLFYVNNIFTVSEPCFQHGWYLAADFQMFIVGTIMHMIIWK